MELEGLRQARIVLRGTHRLPLHRNDL